VTTRAASNCTTTGNGSYGTLPTDVSSDWSNVFSTSTTLYPICALTYDLAFNDYSRGSVFTGGQALATTVHDYFSYVLNSTGGQSDFAGNDYAILPPDVQLKSINGLPLIVD